MEINSSPDATPQKKDLFLSVFLLVGALASLIGYWGWVERSEKDLKAGKPEKMQDFKVDVVEESSDVDDLTQMAIISAEETANKVLADQISLTLKKMEKEMVVPQPLLEQLQSEKKEVIFQGLDPLIEHASAMEPVIKKDWIDQALSFGSGYLFRPGKESLGKITGVTQLQQKILFKRADWSNPQASFGLSVSDYEVRLGSDSLGFIILVGEVRRQETDTDYGNPPSPVYSLQPSRAWWLDKNQTRTEIDLLSLTEK